MVTKLGPERCAMRSPAGWETFVQGSGNIDTKLLQGWVIVPTPRNHLTRELLTKEKLEKNKEELFAALSAINDDGGLIKQEPEGSEHEPKGDTAEPNFTTEHEGEIAKPETRAAIGRPKRKRTNEHR